MEPSSLPDLAAAVCRDGAATWQAFLTPARTARLGDHTAALATGEHADHYPKSTRVWDLYRHGDTFVDLLADERLCELLETLLGEHHLLSDYSLNVVHPGQPLDDWHIDYPYNEMPHLVDGALLGLQCVLALDHFRADNGATQYVPCSHRHPRRRRTPGPQPRRVFEAEPGDLLIMAAATLHRSGPNQSGTSRTAILLSFVERWIRPMTGPPEPGPWGHTTQLRVLLGMERPPETINGVPIT